MKSIKPIEKSKSPISSKNVKSLSKLQTIVEEKINDASILPPIKKRSHKNYNNRYPRSSTTNKNIRWKKKNQKK